ncbi:hypothetical protein AB0E04_45995 [Streptomyces sp. NPDC048251]|uniref:hypothetical protein n=1 Tax=Streptomyces sp. NPDC048251 TaxID=3154501 RepID=UPI00342B09F6
MLDQDFCRVQALLAESLCEIRDLRALACGGAAQQDVGSVVPRLSLLERQRGQEVDGALGERGEAVGRQHLPEQTQHLGYRCVRARHQMRQQLPQQLAAVLHEGLNDLAQARTVRSVGDKERDSLSDDRDRLPRCVVQERRRQIALPGVGELLV